MLIFYIGFTAQVLFSARMIVQWIKSETAGRVLSPVLFWQLSLAGAMLLTRGASLPPGRLRLSVAVGDREESEIIVSALVISKRVGCPGRPGA